MSKTEFSPSMAGLEKALARLVAKPTVDQAIPPLPDALPKTGLGPDQALDLLAPRVLDHATDLGSPTAFAHMDPPTPWITWAAALWTASKNQNLLHPATAPEARGLEECVIQWLAPVFGMSGGHMVPGSTLANLTALWAAREVKGITRVVTSTGAHLSIKKSAHILGLDYEAINTDDLGRADLSGLSGDLSKTALVLTAGTTSIGAVDPLTEGAALGAGWVHVDAAWAGPLCLSEHYADRLAGIELADSVAISAHKWLFQPKESALILFQDDATAHQAISFGGGYLAVPNVGVLGSHGAMAVPLLATLLAYGRDGLVAMVEETMAAMEKLAAAVANNPKLELYAPPVTGVMLWRPRDTQTMEAGFNKLPEGATSKAIVRGETWYRQVAANPCVHIDDIIAKINEIF